MNMVNFDEIPSHLVLNIYMSKKPEDQAFRKKLAIAEKHLLCGKTSKFRRALFEKARIF